MNPVVLAGGCALLVLAACSAAPDEAPAPPAIAPARNRVAPPAPALASATLGPPAGERDLAQLREQIESLARDVAELRQQVSRAHAGTPPVERMADPRVDPEARAAVERERFLRAAGLESAFRREPHDPAWSMAAVAGVRAALAEADEPMRTWVGSVECRSQSCRVEIDSAAAGPLAQALPLLLGRLVTTFPSATAAQLDQGNGGGATVLYLSR